MTANEIYEFVQKNRKDMKKEVMAVRCKKSIDMINYYLYNYTPRVFKEKVVKESVRSYTYNASPPRPTDFETNGFFDVDKHALCMNI